MVTTRFRVTNTSKNPIIVIPKPINVKIEEIKLKYSENIDIDSFNEAEKKSIEFFENRKFLFSPFETSKYTNDTINKEIKLSEDEELEDANFLKSLDIEEFLNTLGKPEPGSDPSIKQRKLKDYQNKTLHNLIFRRRKGLNFLLADEPGVGKTDPICVYLIYLIVKIKVNNPILLLVPTQLLYNWKNTIETYSKDVDVIFFYEKNKKFTRTNLNRPFILLTSLETACHNNNNLKNFHSIYWSCVIVDEAHKVKNNEAKKYNFIKNLRKTQLVLMTGTPFQNNYNEIYSLFTLLIPNNILGKKNDYFKNDNISNELIYQTSKEIYRMLKLIMLRRKLKDINTDLPEKIEKLIYIDLSKKQIQLYNALIFEKLNIKSEMFNDLSGFNKTSNQGVDSKISDAVDHGFLFPKLRYETKAGIIFRSSKNLTNENEIDEFVDNSIEYSSKIKILDQLLKEIFSDDNDANQTNKVIIFFNRTYTIDYVKIYLKYARFMYEKDYYCWNYDGDSFVDKNKVFNEENEYYDQNYEDELEYVMKTCYDEKYERKKTIKKENFYDNDNSQFPRSNVEFEDKEEDIFQKLKDEGYEYEKRLSNRQKKEKRDNTKKTKKRKTRISKNKDEEDVRTTFSNSDDEEEEKSHDDNNDDDDDDDNNNNEIDLVDGSSKEDILKAFKLNKNLKILLITTKSGGAGLNLQSANYVIFFDSEWNPQNDIQAIHRAWRTGQTRPVTIIYLLTNTYYEIRKYKEAETKKALAEFYIDTGKLLLDKQNTNKDNIEEDKTIVKNIKFGFDQIYDVECLQRLQSDKVFKDCVNESNSFDELFKKYYKKFITPLNIKKEEEVDFKSFECNSCLISKEEFDIIVDYSNKDKDNILNLISIKFNYEIFNLELKYDCFYSLDDELLNKKENYDKIEFLDKSDLEKLKESSNEDNTKLHELIKLKLSAFRSFKDKLNIVINPKYIKTVVSFDENKFKEKYLNKKSLNDFILDRKRINLVFEKQNKLVELEKDEKKEEIDKKSIRKKFKSKYEKKEFQFFNNFNTVKTLEYDIFNLENKLIEENETSDKLENARILSPFDTTIITTIDEHNQIIKDKTNELKQKKIDLKVILSKSFVKWSKTKFNIYKKYKSKNKTIDEIRTALKSAFTNQQITEYDIAYCSNYLFLPKEYQLPPLPKKNKKEEEEEEEEEDKKRKKEEDLFDVDGNLIKPINYNSNIEKEFYYTKNEDKGILWFKHVLTEPTGEADWNKIKDAIDNSDYFQYNWIIKNKSAKELKARYEKLKTYIV